MEILFSLKTHIFKVFIIRRVDDIQDSSELRRGVPSSYTIYGAPPSMNASAYVMTDVTHRVHNVFRDANVLLTFVKYVKFIHMSQGMDLYYRDIQCNKDDLKEANIPTEEEYNKILVYKTAGQLMMMATLLGAKSKTGIDVVPLAQIIGHHFQIRDDYLNIMSKQYEEKKGFCDDLVEGKFSLPVIFALHLPY
ncbi:geranylgeranyl pyrophosphate synthase [Folsomia candida]|nr:geranylgeranyl pyrophosphate synthase [Folsomia candida]